MGAGRGNLKTAGGAVLQVRLRELMLLKEHSGAENGT